MIITMIRLSHGIHSTLGVIQCGDYTSFTCEDEYRKEKVKGETRIPAGTYEIKLRDAGGMNEKYKANYSFHRGMLHLQDVPGFEWVYIHVGNTEKDSSGCILVGYGGEVDELGGGYVQRSKSAYTDLYKLILKAFDRGESVHIVIKDYLHA